MNNTLPIQNNLYLMPTSKIIEYYLSQQTAGTSRTYGSTLRSFFAWTNGRSYKEISPFDALEFDKYLKATCSAATVQRQISTLKKFFDFAMECGLIDKNPFAVVKQTGATCRSAERFLTPKEINLLLSSLKQLGQKHYILGLLLASTGVRVSEAQKLSWCDFIEMPDGTICITVLRKGGKRQLLPLRDDVFKAVKAFMGREIDQSDQSPLFLNSSKNRASDISLRAWIERGVELAGIKKKATPHFLRHSFATNALDQKADIRDVSDYLGHSSIKTTSIYAHSTNSKVGDVLKLHIEE